MKKRELQTSEKYAELRTQIKLIKNDIIILLQELDELKLHEEPALRTRYFSLFGKFVSMIEEKDILIAELRYRISLYQAAINSKKPIVQEEVDELVSDKYNSYYEQLNRKMGKEQEQAEAFQKREEEKQKYQEEFEKSGNSFKATLKEIYRKLVKLLHPDMNSDDNDRTRRYWDLVQEAYKNNDLDKLQQLLSEVQLNRVVAEVDEVNEKEQLTNLLSQLIQKKAVLLSEKNMLLSSFPFTERELLLDSTRIQQKCSEFKKFLEEQDQTIQELQIELNDLINSNQNVMD